MTEPPKVMAREELIKNFDADGSPCEVCDQRLHGHEWVLMSVGGIVIFCSNLEFETQGDTFLLSTFMRTDSDTEDIEWGNISRGEEIASIEKQTEHVLRNEGHKWANLNTYTEYIFRGGKKVIRQWVNPNFR